ncbi:MAG TPA: hypothetical protein RMH99_13105 [Sandaracinaceae bacterium LLY-WYZ-13_1]|nr:hypothetical protein [Sandaracinaceae bacterium LLY-WYZ-13_1]
MSTTSTPGGGIKEYFLLADARATAKRIPEDARAGLARKLGIGRQRAEAADALWSNGHTAEGLRLAAEAFETTLEALPELADASGLEVAAVERQAPTEAGATPADEADERAEDEGAAAAEAKADDEPEAKADDEPEAEADDEPEAEADDEPEAEADDEPEAKADDEPEAKAAGDRDDAGDAPAGAGRARVSRPAAESGWAGVLRARGLSSGKIEDVAEAEEALRRTDLPALDDEVSAKHGELFQQLIGARRQVDKVVGPATMTPAQLTWTQLSRIGFALLLLLVAGVGAYFLLRTPEGIEARASGRWSADFPPEHVIDDDPATEWLMPDRSRGWVEVEISPPTHVGQLRLLNSHNRHYNDRATREYSVEIWADGEQVRTIEGSWDQVDPHPEWTEHEVGVDEVERIRFNVRSWHRNGGGLAELDWE